MVDSINKINLMTCPDYALFGKFLINFSCESRLDCPLWPEKLTAPEYGRFLAARFLSFECGIIRGFSALRLCSQPRLWHLLYQLSNLGLIYYPPPQKVKFSGIVRIDS